MDKYFEEFLKEFFGDELYDIYIKNAVARLEILKHFEMLKRKFNPGQDDRSRLQLSYLNEDLTPTKLAELIEKHNKSHSAEYHLKQRGTSCIDLPLNLMISFFHTLVENIKSKVEQLLQQAENKVGYKAKFIFMVGGFSESPYLKSEIKKKFETDSLTVLAPRRPQVSVIRGACMYGLNPRSITSRIAKKTYGINTLTTFDPERHPEEKKVLY